MSVISTRLLLCHGLFRDLLKISACLSRIRQAGEAQEKY